MHGMKNRIEKEIEYLEFEIEEHRNILNREAEEFLRFIASRKARDRASTIVCIPRYSLFQHIQSDYETIQRLDDKRRWLLHLLEDCLQEENQ